MVYTFTDMQGRTILTRAMDGTTAHDTYSVYDASGNLCYVLQPMFQEDGELSKYAFRYEYDERNRLAKKTLPGTEPVEYVYDLKDRMTFSQDGNQREAGKWTYYLYDNLNRLTEQGECTGKDLATKTVLLQNYYDDYAFRGSAGFDNADFPAGTVDATGYLTGTAQRVLGTDKMLHAAYYYDIKGRVTKEVQENLLGGYDVTETAYTFTGNPQTVTHTHSASGKPTVTEVYAYTYDHADRVTKVEHTLDGTKVTLAGYEYDELGRVKARTLHGNAANRQAYAYNIRGWLTNISGNRFMQNLYYETGSGTPAYNGNISSMTWRAGSEGTMRGYKFAYDGLDRLKSATYGEGMFINANTGRFSENVTSYDLNGNITGLQRYGQTSASAYGLVDNLTFTLNGNRLDRVDDTATGGLFGDAVKQSGEYAYDENGNMTQDLNKNISEIEYNCLNLPGKVTFTDGSTITYTYAADGTKLNTVHTIGGATTTTDYCGNAVYENGTLKYLLTDEGYVTPADGKYHYYLTDHLGNNRVVVDQNGTVEEVNHYYPFGEMFASTDVQPYKYNGKEWNEDAKWYDYGARNYDAAVGRFITIDPSAESYSNSSTYAYCLNNPVKFVDPDGRKIVVGTIWQRIAASLGFENYVTKVYKHLYQNNMDSRRIQSLYKQLEQSDLIFRILPISESPTPNASEKGNHVKPDKPVVRGEKQGGTIYYDPDSYFTVNKEYRTPRIGLAHELGHLENLMKGKAFPIDKERKEAKDPVELYRNELNEEIRHSYFKNSTIDEEEKDEKKKINNN